MECQVCWWLGNNYSYHLPLTAQGTMTLTLVCGIMTWAWEKMGRSIMPKLLWNNLHNSSCTLSPRGQTKSDIQALTNNTHSQFTEGFYPYIHITGLCMTSSIIPVCHATYLVQGCLLCLIRHCVFCVPINIAHWPMMPCHRYIFLQINHSKSINISCNLSSQLLTILFVFSLQFINQVTASLFETLSTSTCWMTPESLIILWLCYKLCVL